MIELFAAIFTLWCVYLTYKRKILSWPIGIIAIFLYTYVFYSVKLYADLGLQVIFLIQSVYGWYNWNKYKDTEEKVIISRISTYEITAILIFFALFSNLLFYILTAYTDASLPYFDSRLTTISIIANWLLSRRKIENWFIWVLADFIYVFLFIYKHLYYSSILYFILLILAIIGYLNWNKSLNKNE